MLFEWMLAKDVAEQKASHGSWELVCHTNQLGLYFISTEIFMKVFKEESVEIISKF